MYKVLIIDDEQSAIDEIRELIDWGEHGYEIVAECDDSTLAIRLIRKLVPDVVLCDINMPVVSGIVLASEIKNLNLKSKIVFMSAYEKFEFAHQAIKIGINDYILKPVMKHELIQTLTKIKKNLDRENNILKNTMDYRVKYVINEIREKYAEDLNIYFYAEKYRINKNYFSQLFKKETGVSFTEYVINVRVEMAIELIKNTNMTLIEIAKKVGYDNYYHFCKIFKKYAGRNPNAYRRL